MVIKSIALVAFTAAFSSSVNAAIISVDWQSAGDNLITEDTVNGLQWLDLTVTANLSYNAVVAQMGSGGTYEGWSYASNANVVSLFGEFGGSGSYTGGSSAHNVMFDNGLLEVWGATSLGAARDQSYFLYGDVISSTSIVAGRVIDKFEITAPDYVHLSELTYPVGSDSTSIGSALVRAATPAVVPVPAAAWLFGSGLLGLLGVARRKVRS